MAEALDDPPVDDALDEAPTIASGSFDCVSASEEEMAGAPVPDSATAVPPATPVPTPATSVFDTDSDDDVEFTDASLRFITLSTASSAKSRCQSEARSLGPSSARSAGFRRWQTVRQKVNT